MAKEILTTAPTLTVSDAPFWHCGRSVQGIMRDYLIALLPAAVMAVVMYGFDALRVIALSGATAMIVEGLTLHYLKRDLQLDNYSALLQGVLFAFLLPAGAPWWLVVAGCALMMLLGRLVFGGLGANPVCPPLVGWAIITIAWKLFMDPDASVLNTQLVNPLTQLRYFGVDKVAHFTTFDLLSGNQLGALGASQVGALLLGGIYLLARRVISWHIPVAFIGTVAIIASIFYFGENGEQYASPVFHVLTGSVVFAAFFLATDYSSSPVGSVPMLIFGAFAGFMVMMIRIYGIYPDGVPFALLLANLAVPLLEIIRPKPFGAVR